MTTSFSDLGVPRPLVATLNDSGIASPFPIQVDTLPDTLAGRDVLGRGRTGSGKTLAFSIPLAARLAGGAARAPGRPRGLVLAPTRELATQIAAVVEPLAHSSGLRVTTIFGGVSQNRQVEALRRGVDIVIACPGRLEDLMRQKFVSLEDIEITVLDEADHMADLGFLPGVTRIMNATPKDGQRLLFSATLDNGVDKLVKRFLHNQVMHSVDEANSPVAAMTHHIYDVPGLDAKKDLIRTLASGSGRRILFMRTKHQARKLAKQLTDSGIPAVDLHGNLSQNARDRNLAAFSSGEARVLVATDVAARGVHVDDVELVVHVDPPAEHKAYLHRSGRTARAGSAGDVVTLVLPEQRKDLAVIMRKASINVTPIKSTANSEHVLALVGEVAAYVAPKPVQTPTAGASRPQRSGSGGGGRRRTTPSQGGGASRQGSGSASRQGAGSATRQGASAGQRSSTAQRSSAGQGGAAASTGRRRATRQAVTPR